MILSCLAYFLVDIEDPRNGGSQITRAVKDFIAKFLNPFMKAQNSQPTEGTTDRAIYYDEQRTPRKNTSSGTRLSMEMSSSPMHWKESPARFRGRRFLLLAFFAAAVMTIFLSAMVFTIHGCGGTIFIIIMITGFLAPVSKAIFVV